MEKGEKRQLEVSFLHCPEIEAGFCQKCRSDTQHKIEKREVCCGSWVNESSSVKPVDFDVDFEGLAIARKEVSEASGKRV